MRYGPHTVLDNAGMVLAAILDAETDASVMEIMAQPDEAERSRRRSMTCAHASWPSWQRTATASHHACRDGGRSASRRLANRPPKGPHPFVQKPTLGPHQSAKAQFLAHWWRCLIHHVAASLAISANLKALRGYPMRAFEVSRLKEAESLSG